MAIYDVFITILSDYINKRKSVIDICPADKRNLIEFAKKHNVEGIIYHQIHIQELQKAYAATLYININRETEEKFLFQALSQFEYFPIKGQCLAPLYPNPYLRTMGDIDIMIREQDRLAIHTILCDNLGYTNITQGETVWNYRKQSIELEIHTKMINAKFNYDQKYEDDFLQCWNYVSGHEFDWNFHFLYLIAHLRKHFMNSGVGIRQFMDIAIVELNINLDWKWIEKEARTIGLFDFMRTVLSYINIWFGITSPYDIVEIEQENFEMSTELIMNNGVFGFDNKDNNANIAVNQYIDTGNKNIRGIVDRIFPNSEQLIKEGYMREGQSKIMCPVAWGKRVWNKRDHIVKFIDSVPFSDRINKRKQLYAHWGL